MPVSETLLILAALAAGLKHGVDYDHIAAIMDITSTQQSKRRGIWLSFLYAIGHASVVAALALFALMLGVSLPEWVDATMGRVIGVTLILLGVYVLYTLHRHRGDDFRMLPRWAILANGLLKIYDYAEAKLKNAPMKNRSVLKSGYGSTSAYAIGMIHGIGAETPTQVFLFVLALSAGVAADRKVGAVLIIAFVLGLVLTNTLMGALGSYGYVTSSKRQKLYRGAALVTGVFSFLLGSIFLFGADELLPEIEALLG